MRTILSLVLLAIMTDITAAEPLSFSITNTIRESEGTIRWSMSRGLPSASVEIAFEADDIDTTEWLIDGTNAADYGLD